MSRTSGALGTDIAVMVGAFGLRMSRNKTINTIGQPSLTRAPTGKVVSHFVFFALFRALRGPNPCRH
jgi:hypothetical protein